MTGIPDNVVVRLVGLPLRVGAVTVISSADECFNIYLNASRTEEERRTALDHELRHILSDHFYKKERPVALCEREAKEAEK